MTLTGTNPTCIVWEDMVGTQEGARPAVINARRIHPGDLARVIAATERVTGMPVIVMNAQPRKPLGYLFPSGCKPPGSKLAKRFARGRRIRGH